jgi:hypothetical protein
MHLSLDELDAVFRIGRVSLAGTPLPEAPVVLPTRLDVREPTV